MDIGFGSLAVSWGELGVIEGDLGVSWEPLQDSVGSHLRVTWGSIWSTWGDSKPLGRSLGGPLRVTWGHLRGRLRVT